MPSTTSPLADASVPQAPASAVTIQWCLISHTNIGKTTLARTLLAQDVGDIRDEAHVTDSADEYLLLETTQGHRLTLWDTPGFGDSVRLQQRLAQQGNPLGWFLTHVWDRWRDKPFWMSQRAMRAARDHADVVLYLVNAAEDPQDAGYLEAEMNILQWLQKPVIVLLNQIGQNLPPEQEQQDIGRWQQAMQGYGSLVREVLALDAFTRSWVHELALFQTAGGALPAGQQAAWRDISHAWRQRSIERLRHSMAALAELLVFAASQQAAIEKPAESGWQQAKRLVGLGGEARQRAEQQAMQSILRALDAQSQAATRKLLRLHGLDGKAAEQLRQQLQDYFTIRQPLDAAQAGLWGAIASGAATGVGADLATGGLTFGAGALLGAIAGAITFAGAAWGVNKAREQEGHSVYLSDGFLDGLVESSLLQYLAVAHFGRGRGSFTETDAPAHWLAAVQPSVANQRGIWHDIWAGIRQDLQARADPVGLDKRRQAAAELLDDAIHAALKKLYPAITIS